MNTYAGMFYRHNNIKELSVLKMEGLGKFGKYLEWNYSKNCFRLQKPYRFKARVAEFFGLLDRVGCKKC